MGDNMSKRPLDDSQPTSPAKKLKVTGPEVNPCLLLLLLATRDQGSPLSLLADGAGSMILKRIWKFVVFVVPGYIAQLLKKEPLVFHIEEAYKHDGLSKQAKKKIAKFGGGLEWLLDRGLTQTKGFKKITEVYTKRDLSEDKVNQILKDVADEVCYQLIEYRMDGLAMLLESEDKVDVFQKKSWRRLEESIEEEYEYTKEPFKFSITTTTKGGDIRESFEEQLFAILGSVNKFSEDALSLCLYFKFGNGY